MLLTPIPGTVPGASDYVGGADSVSASNIANTSMKRQYYAGYFQDDFKVTSKLTLNLGLRYEYFGQLIENYGAQSNFILTGANGHSTFLLTKKRCNTPLSTDFKAAAVTDGIDIVCSSQPGLGESQKLNFSPRFGFAYQLTPKLVARGGYGIFYGGFENSVIETYVDFPFQYTLGYSYQVPNAPITFNNGSIGTLETGITGIPLTSAAVEPGGVSFTGEDYHMKTPYTQGYNLTVQYAVKPQRYSAIGLCREYGPSYGHVRQPEYSPGDPAAWTECPVVFARILIFLHTWSIPLFQAIATTILSKPTTNGESAMA